MRSDDWKRQRQAELRTLLGGIESVCRRTTGRVTNEPIWIEIGVTDDEIVDVDVNGWEATADCIVEGVWKLRLGPSFNRNASFSLQFPPPR